MISPNATKIEHPMGRAMTELDSILLQGTHKAIIIVSES